MKRSKPKNAVWNFLFIDASGNTTGAFSFLRAKKTLAMKIVNEYFISIFVFYRSFSVNGPVGPGASRSYSDNRKEGR